MARLIGAAMAVCLFALPALGASPFRGHWQVALATNPQYLGMVLIDDDGRAVWEPSDIPWRGYVSKFDGGNAQITLTNGNTVTHVRCRILSSDLLDCHAHRAAGISDGFILKRVGENVPKLWRGVR